MKFLNYRILAMLAIIVVIGALGVLTREYGSMDWMIDNETNLREFVRFHPWQSWVVGFAIFTLFALIPGSAGKSVIVGWLFGFWQAVLLVDIGLTIAAIGAFFVSRFLIRETVNARFGGLVKKLDRGLEKDGAFYLLMMRVAHMPFSFVNYGVGATSVSPWKFCWTTALGILPGTMIFVFVGTRIPTLAEISEKGLWLLFDPILAALFAGTFVLPLLIRWAIHRFYRQPGTPPEFEISEAETVNPLFFGGRSDGSR